MENNTAKHSCAHGLVPESFWSDWRVHPRGIWGCRHERQQQTSQTCPCSSFAGSPPPLPFFWASFFLFFSFKCMSSAILSSRFLPSVIQLYFFLLYISVPTSLFLLSHDNHRIPLDHMHNTKEVLQLMILMPIIDTATLPSFSQPCSLHQLRLSTSGARLRNVYPLLVHCWSKNGSGCWETLKQTPTKMKAWHYQQRPEPILGKNVIQSLILEPQFWDPKSIQGIHVPQRPQSGSWLLTITSGY